jgi:CRISPR-associated protein Cmr4
VFVWVTCPLVLRRFQRLTDIEFDIPEPNNEEAYVCEINNEKIELEEMDFIAKTDNNVKNIAEKLSNSSPDDYMKAKIAKDLVIVSDEMFKNIVKTMTEIVPRIRIGENGVVKQGALWYEEYLPQDTVMYFVCRSDKNELNGDLDELNGKIITIGGKESTGKGIVFIKKVI